MRLWVGYILLFVLCFGSVWGILRLLPKRTVSSHPPPQRRVAKPEDDFPPDAA